MTPSLAQRRQQHQYKSSLVKEGGKPLLSPKVTQTIFESRSNDLNEQHDTTNGLALPILIRTIFDQIVQTQIKLAQK